jgi:hypothetical protein
MVGLERMTHPAREAEDAGGQRGEHCGNA